MKNRNTIPSLYGLRALSVLMVIAYHLENSVPEFEIPFIFKPILNGHLGVNIFFVISGFLITSLLMKEMDEKGRIDLKGFFKRRALRILPAYYFLLLIYFILQTAGVIHLDRSDWFFSATLLKQFNNPGGITAHLWSISAEEIFYLFYPPLFIWLYPADKRILNYILLAITLAIVPAFRVILTNKFHTFGFNIFMRGDAIALGCLLALNYTYLKVNIVHNQLKTWIGIPILLFMSSMLFLPELTEAYPALILWGGQGWSLLDNMVIVLLLTVAIEDKGSIFFAILNSAPMIFLGRISYSIYLWQQLFTSNLELGYLNVFPFNLVAILCASVLSYKLIEQPFLKMKMIS